ncbi:MAG: hypothetical protein AAB521_04260 [Patescibacteria group bacterium]
MADFKFVQDKASGKWIVLAPRRAKRPDVAKEASPLCPFCVGMEKEEPDVYRVPARNASASEAGGGGEAGDSNWQVRVIPNKFPFAPIHELIIHSPDHHKNFDELPISQAETIIQVYKQRYNTHKASGQAYLFHNRGEAGGESLPHPHTQLAVVPHDVVLDIPPLNSDEDEKIEAGSFFIFCPPTSQWPDEIWIAPKTKGKVFGDISDEEVSDLAFIINRLIKILDLRHGHEFPFNFYIYPGNDWYMRIIPRVKTLGGFEVGTGIFVNTQDPNDTFLFLKEHFDTPDEEKIKTHHRADYGRSV